MIVKPFPRMESLWWRIIRRIFRNAPTTLWPALSIPVILMGASVIFETNAAAAPRSQSTYRPAGLNPSAAVPAVPPKSTDYLRVTGPGAILLVEPVKIVRASRPTYPESEELARDPEAYAKAAAERGGYGGVAHSDAETRKGINISVGGDVLPEVSVSPYSRARVRPEDVVLFFKDEKLDGLRGGIAYPAARLRFDPATRDVRTSSSATYTSQ
jgi:hypothetical protein